MGNALVAAACALLLGVANPLLPSAAVTLAFIADMAKPTSGRDVPAYATIAAEAPDLVLMIGDMSHYLGAGSPPPEPWQVRRMHCEVQGLTGTGCGGAQLWPAGQDWQAWMTGFPLLAIYDDHELNDNTHRLTPGWDVLIPEHRARFPGAYASPNGSWQTLGVGGLVRVVMLDTRAQRDPPGTPNGSILGAEQEAWLDALLPMIQEPWIVIVSTVPLNGKPLDAWPVHPTAQASMLARLAACGVRCVVVSADMHTGGGIDAGRREMTIPHLNLPNNIGWGSCAPPNCGTWSEGLFMGEGRPGYGLITATATTLRMSARKALDGAERVALELTQ